MRPDRHHHHPRVRRVDPANPWWSAACPCGWAARLAPGWRAALHRALLHSTEIAP